MTHDEIDFEKWWDSLDDIEREEYSQSMKECEDSEQE